jgi:lipopolysaccharide/colanic/teichoic acid biosynthesis glycosyltransferase
MKRQFDIFVAACGIIILTPLLLLIALAVLLDSGFPLLYLQIRVGKAGKDFWLAKFRTMSVKTETEKGVFEAGNTSRVTRVGRVLRKTKLDELPQLWNVLVGDMSLVGPRPEVRRWVDAYPDRWKIVLSIRPGITDSASILFRNEEEILACADNPELFYHDFILPRKLDLYTAYVEENSFWGDLCILAKTLISVIHARSDKE